jgi:hypothetical protein
LVVEPLGRTAGAVADQSLGHIFGTRLLAVELIEWLHGDSPAEHRLGVASNSTRNESVGWRTSIGVVASQFSDASVDVTSIAWVSSR